MTTQRRSAASADVCTGQDLEQTHVAGRDHPRHLLAIMFMRWIIPLLSPCIPETLVRLERCHCVQEMVHVVLRPDPVLHTQLIDLPFRLSGPGHEVDLLAVHVLEKLQLRPSLVPEGFSQVDGAV